MSASVWIFLAMSALLYVASSQESCKTLDHMCNGVCVPEKSLCDGIPHCVDGSDESSNLCQLRPCRSDLGMLSSLVSSLMFRCTYGACIAIPFKCNGRPDCFDSSDETEQLCSQQLCPKNTFRCAYGACVNKMDRCNGIVDCVDGSDETEELCVRLRRSCRKDYFRCDYGACIYYRKKCDGKLDCADGSDESFSTCGQKNVFPNFISTSTTMKTNISLLATTYVPTMESISLISSIKSTTYKSTSPIFPTTIATKPTLAPHITFETDVHINDSNTDFSFIANAPEVKSLEGNVSNSDDIKNFEANEPINTLNISNGSLQTLPFYHSPPCSPEECLCPPMNEVCVPCPHDVNLQDVCNQFGEKEVFCSISRYENVEIDIISCGETEKIPNVPNDFIRLSYTDCDNGERVPVNTLALVDCWGKSTELYFCKEDRKWHSNDDTQNSQWHHLNAGMSSSTTTELCQEPNLNPKVCGRLPRVKITSRRLRWPFLVGVFEDDLFLCSGTLIASQWVLTAAHCIEKHQKERSSIGIDARKESISLRIQHSLWNQSISMPKVSHAFLHPNYSSFPTRFIKNLALLKLEVRLTLSENLVPICLDGSNGKQLFASTATTFTHQEGHDGVKWNVAAKTVSQNCFNTKSEFPHELEEDQFCVRSLGGSEMVHDKPLDGPCLLNDGPEHKERWTLLGVFSYSIDMPNGQVQYIFTSVRNNIDWIRSCVKKKSLYVDA